MKKFLLLAALAVCTPAIVHADEPQPVKSSAPESKIAPEVIDLFDKAAFSYSGLASYSGDVRIEIENKGLNAVTTGSFFYGRKARIKFEAKIEATADGGEKKTATTTFKSDGVRYQSSRTDEDGKVELSPVEKLNNDGRADAAWQNAPLDSLSPLLIAGVNDLRDTKDPIEAEMLPAKTVGDETFDGVKLTATEGEYKDMEVEAYFDSKHHLLREITISLNIEGAPAKIRTVYSNLVFNPAITLNMFTIN